MKLFQPNERKPSLKERAFLAEREELNDLAKLRYEKEQEYKEFLKKTQAKSEETERIYAEREKLARESVESLEREVSDLESKRQALEKSADEQIYKARREAFYKLEEEAEQKRNFLDQRLQEIESSRTAFSFIVQEHEEAEEALRADRQSFETNRREIASKLAQERVELSSGMARLEKLGNDLGERSKALDAQLAEVLARTEANKVFEQALKEKEKAQEKERKALKDAYKELEKSRERILGRNT